MSDEQVLPAVPEGVHANAPTLHLIGDPEPTPVEEPAAPAPVEPSPEEVEAQREAEANAAAAAAAVSPAPTDEPHDGQTTAPAVPADAAPVEGAPEVAPEPEATPEAEAPSQVEEGEPVADPLGALPETPPASADVAESEHEEVAPAEGDAPAE